MREVYAYKVECVNPSMFSKVSQSVSFAASYPATGEMGDEDFQFPRGMFRIVRSEGSHGGYEVDGEG